MAGMAGCACGETHSGTDASISEVSIPDVAPDTSGPSLPRDARYDFDGDGHADLVVGDPSYRGGRGAVWLVRASEGGPLAPTLIAAGGPDEHLGTHVFPVSDQDGDGRYEVGTYQQEDPALGRWRGRWLGTAGGTGELPGADLVPLAVLSTVASVDLDRDPAPDIVLAYGCGSRCGGQLEISATGVEDVGDGRRAFVIAVPGSARLWPVHHREEGRWPPPDGGPRVPHCGAPAGRRAPAGGDVDGDGETDLLVNGVIAPATFQTLLLTRLGDELRTQPLPGNFLPDGDRDCDGFDDLFEPTEDVWLPGGAGGVAEPTSPPADAARGAHVDLDLDGCRDSAVLDGADAYLQGGRGSPRWPLDLPSSIHRAESFPLIDDAVWARSPYASQQAFRPQDGGLVAVDVMPDLSSQFGDVTGDGLDDAIAYDGLATWRGTGRGFERAALPALGGTSTVAGDVDGDGDDDVVVVEASLTRIMRGGPLFPGEGTLATLTPAQMVETIGDVDGDGHTDLGSFGLSAHVWLGRDLVAGDAVAHHTYAGDSISPAFMPSDVDGDGLDDLVLANALFVRVHRGRRDDAPDPEPWELSFAADALVYRRLGPDGLFLPLAPTGTTLRVQRLTRDGPVDHAAIDVPLSVIGARFEGRLLVLPWAEEDGVHVYRVLRGALEGPTVITLPPGELRERPVTFSPTLWQP